MSKFETERLILGVITMETGNERSASSAIKSSEVSISQQICTDEQVSKSKDIIRPAIVDT